MYPLNLSNKSGIPAIIVSNLTNSKYTRFMKAANTDMYLFNLSEKSDTKKFITEHYTRYCIRWCSYQIKYSFMQCI